jgi:hypothetical protein
MPILSFSVPPGGRKSLSMSGVIKPSAASMPAAPLPCWPPSSWSFSGPPSCCSPTTSSGSSMPTAACRNADGPGNHPLPAPGPESRTVAPGRRTHLRRQFARLAPAVDVRRHADRQPPEHPRASRRRPAGAGDRAVPQRSRPPVDPRRQSPGRLLRRMAAAGSPPRHAGRRCLDPGRRPGDQRPQRSHRGDAAWPATS